MIRISNKLALDMIVNGEDKGCGFVTIKMKDSEEKIPANYYTRIYEGDRYEIVEIEHETESEFYVIADNDIVTTSTSNELSDTLNGLKDTLKDIINTLKEVE